MLYDEKSIRAALKTIPEAVQCDECDTLHCWRCYPIHDKKLEFKCECLCHDRNNPNGW